MKLFFKSAKGKHRPTVRRNKSQYTYSTGSILTSLRPPPFFVRLASNAFHDIGSVGRTGKKKKKSQEVSRLEAQVPQDDVKS